jgi:S-formylglutathione hydrolase FrmB
MHRALRSLGIPHEYAESPGGHDWDFVDRALPATLAFVRRHLA